MERLYKRRLRHASLRPRSSPGPPLTSLYGRSQPPQQQRRRRQDQLDNLTAQSTPRRRTREEARDRACPPIRGGAPSTLSITTGCPGSPDVGPVAAPATTAPPHSPTPPQTPPPPPTPPSSAAATGAALAGYLEPNARRSTNTGGGDNERRRSRGSQRRRGRCCGGVEADGRAEPRRTGTGGVRSGRKGNKAAGGERIRQSVGGGTAAAGGK